MSTNSQALRNVPKKKLLIALDELDHRAQEKMASMEKADKEKYFSKVANLKKAYHKYYEANIPLKYWRMEMKDFVGDPVLLELYNKYTADLAAYYKINNPICFAGAYGIGKTYCITNILKRSLEKGYSALYVTLSDIASAVKIDSFGVRKELFTVDFLAVDEFDPRYVSSDLAAEFYGKLVEEIVRHRSQNSLPLFMSTNSPNVLSTFSGAMKQSLESIFNYVEQIPVLGKDYRTIEKEMNRE